MKIYIKIFFLAFALINTTTSNAASNEPILISNPNNGSIDRFLFNFESSEYLVFNQQNQNESLDQISIDINDPLSPFLLRNNLSLRESNFIFDDDDSRILGIDNANNRIISSFLNGDSLIELAAPNIDIINAISVENANTSLQVFTTSDGQLYSINSDGSEPATLLSSNLFSGPFGLDFVDRFRISRDRQTVVFSAFLNFFQRQQIFTVPIDGSADPVLIHTLPFDSDVDALFNFSIDNQKVVYIVETFFDNSIETLTLYSTAIDGSSAPISLGSVTGETVDIDFELSSDGNFLVYSLQNISLDLLDAPSQTADSIGDALFASSLEGQNQTIISIGSLIQDADISRDSQNIIYTRRPFFDEFGFSNLFSATYSEQGSQSTSLFINNNQGQTGGVNEREFIISRDSKYVIFLDAIGNLNRAIIDGSSPTINLLSKISPNAVVEGFRLLGQNPVIVFYGDLNQLGLNQLHSINFDSSNFTTLSLPDNGNVTRLTTSFVGNHVAFGTGTDPVTRDPTALYLTEVNLEPEPLCFPIKAQNGNFVTICL